MSGVASTSRWAPLVLLLALAGCGTGSGAGRKTTVQPQALASIDVALERAALVRKGPAGDTELGLLELMWSGDRAAAEVAFARALKTRPDDALALFGAALADQDALRIAPARERFLRVLELSRKDAVAAALAGVAATELGQLLAEAPGDAGLLPRVRALLAQPLPPELAWDLAGVAVDLEKATGDLGRAVTTSQARGCVRALELRGPFGTLPLLDLDEGTDLPLALAALSRTGARDITATLCGLGLAPASGEPGVLHASATLTGQGAMLLVIDDVDRAPYIVDLGGKEIYRHMSRERFLPRRVVIPITLTGATVLRLRTATRGSMSTFRIGILDPATGHAPAGLTVRAGAQAPAREASAGAAQPLGASPAELGALAARFPGARLAPLAALLAVHAEIRAGDHDGPAVARLGAQLARTPFAAARFLAAQLALERAGVVGWTTARDSAREHFTRLVAASPGSARGLLALAQMDLEDENPRQALARIERALVLAPDAASLHLEHARALRERGFQREADAAVLEAARVFPGGCPVEKALSTLAGAHRDAAGQLGHAEAVTRCDPYDAILLSVLRKRADFAGARKELGRLALAGLSEDALAVERAELSLVEGDAAGAARELGAAVTRRPTDVSRRLSWVDALLAAGQRKDALAAIDAGLAQAPEAAALWSAREVLGEGGPMDAYRIDGVDVIKSYLASGRSYGGPAVVLLDRTVVKIFPTGARLTLTHNVIQVLAKEGLDQWGEVRIPSGARVIKLRTIKPDFSTREPEDIANKDAVSAPDLQIGDYVEYEWIEADAPLNAFGGGFVGDRFYFGTFDAPLDRTEMDIVTPQGLAVLYDVRGDAPRPVTRSENGETHVMFADVQRKQLVSEPASVPNVEVIASTRPYARITWEAWRRMLRQQAWASARADHSVRERAAQIVAARRKQLGHALTPRERAVALYDWVVGNVEGGGGLGMEPAEVLAERAGSRVVLLSALLAAEGMGSQIWLARPRQAGDEPPKLPEVDEASEAILRVDLPGGPVFTELRYKRAPFGFIPPALRGASALKLVAPGPSPEATATAQAQLWGRLPAGEHTDDRRSITLEIGFAAGGMPEVKAVETLRGVPALEWREGLDQIPPDQVERQFEQRVLGYHFPGAELTALKIEGRKDINAPLVLRYSFQAPSLLRPGRGGGIAFSLALYGADLGKAYLGVGSRTRDLIVDDLPLEEVSAKVTLPPGAAMVGAPDPISLDGPYGKFTQTIKADGPGSFTVTQSLRMPLRRVPRTEYEAFSRFVRGIDAAQAREVPLGRK